MNKKKNAPKLMSKPSKKLLIPGLNKPPSAKKLKMELASILGKLNLNIVAYYSFTETFQGEKTEKEILQMKKEIVDAVKYAFAELLGNLQHICEGNGDGDCPEQMKWCEEMKKCIWVHMTCDPNEPGE